MKMRATNSSWLNSTENISVDVLTDMIIINCSMANIFDNYVANDLTVNHQGNANVQQQ
jgi:hypothetical protein